ncbi:50S ribosomal protein L16 [Theileria orientalis]|uniref:50S ribosomal protein L16 n=1 Tax=Theileria orientalis TaxID=68886 RepID=A0A976M6A0_THEOR|nr:50S ribosomal protein L16 [Theileria orientalis]
MPPVFFKAPLPINYKAPKGRIIPLKNPEIRLGKTLVTLTPRRIKAEALERVRMALKRVLKKKTERIVDAHATYPVTKKPEGVKMGQGKGRVHHHVARVPAGYPIIRLPQLSPFVPGELPIFVAFERALSNLPVNCTFRSQLNRFPVDSWVIMRKVGIDKILTKKETEERLERLSQDLDKKNKEESLRVLNDFRHSFEEFLVKYRRRIDTDPEFRLEFLEMLNTISVDPLLSQQRNCFHNAIDLLTPSRRLGELCTLMVEICTSTKNENGGICELSYIISLVPESYRVTETEVLKAANELKHLGFHVTEISGRHYLLLDIELTGTQEKCLSLSSRLGRGISCKDLSDNCGFTQEQAQIVLWELSRLGLVWVDFENTKEGKLIKKI